MKILKVMFIAAVSLLAALVIVPLTVLAGLFVWLKLTEEEDEQTVEFDDSL